MTTLSLDDVTRLPGFGKFGKHMKNAPKMRLRQKASRVKELAMALIAPHKATLTNLKDIPLTIAGTGCVDFAAFHLAHGWGWLVTGMSLILLEHIIAEDQ